MQELTKTELAKFINRSSSIITRLAKDGIFDECFTKTGKKLYLEKAIRAIIKSKGIDYLDKNIVQEFTTPLKAKENPKVNNLESRTELDDLLELEESPLKQVEIIDKYWSGRLRRQKFLEAEGELLSVHDAKVAIDILLTPLNQYLNDMGNSLKNHFPDAPSEIVEWIDEENNRQKEQLRVKEWD